MRSPIGPCHLVWLVVSLHPVFSLGQETGITRIHHPWGRFPQGAWSRVRVITETFDGDNTLTSTTETKTTVQKVEDDGVTLAIESVVRVGGQEIRSEPRVVKQGWHGELTHQDVKITPLGGAQVTIQDRRISCKVEQLELSGATSKTISKIYYSDAVEPFILKRESVRTDLEGTTRLADTTVEVVDRGVPWRILASVNTFVVKAVQRHAKGTAQTISRTSMRVPGEEICRTRNEFDLKGRLVLRSRMELVDYGLSPNERRTVTFRRKRPARLLRWHRFSPYRPHEPAESLD